ncbi:hypothetical protein SKAU_G00122450 [Synaphobranchus kaupii]|uniref:Uncharacterized protein n=1 Tax=Synaphobranchus kaupii TaxID=118154 RepID=A0A9Q1FP20_SYNKA|nr:hypothetical protein SKAU_G00122450 [Synaphobranchus kaupii]
MEWSVQTEQKTDGAPLEDPVRLHFLRGQASDPERLVPRVLQIGSALHSAQRLGLVGPPHGLQHSLPAGLTASSLPRTPGASVLLPCAVAPGVVSPEDQRRQITGQTGQGRNADARTNGKTGKG